MRVNCVATVAAAALCAAVGDASTQEFTLYTGPLTGEHSHSYAWSMDYTEGFGQYVAGSITWLNEGHIPDHHRDGPLAQVWGRFPLSQRRFVIALGVGPYGYFDTEAASQGRVSLHCLASTRSTDIEIKLLAGATILNSPGSETSAAEAIEYRCGLTRYLDATLGYLHEGNGLTARRDGLTAQLWLARYSHDTDVILVGIGLSLLARRARRL